MNYVDVGGFIDGYINDDKKKPEWARTKKCLLDRLKRGERDDKIKKFVELMVEYLKNITTDHGMNDVVEKMVDLVGGSAIHDQYMRNRYHKYLGWVVCAYQLVKPDINTVGDAHHKNETFRNCQQYLVDVFIDDVLDGVCEREQRMKHRKDVVASRIMEYKYSLKR